MKYSWLKNTLLSLGLLLALGLVIQFFGKDIAAALGSAFTSFVTILKIIGYAAVIVVILGLVGGIVVFGWKYVSRARGQQPLGGTHSASAAPQTAGAGHGHAPATPHTTIVGISPLGTTAMILVAAVCIIALVFLVMTWWMGVNSDAVLQGIVSSIACIVFAGGIYMFIMGKKLAAQILVLLALLLFFIPVSTILLYKNKLNEILVENVSSTSVVTTTVADDGIPPLKVMDAVLGMSPTWHKKPQNGCVAAFGPGSDNAHMQFSGGMYYFTAAAPVQVTLGWFPANSNKCN